MADIALAQTARVEIVESLEQMTLPAAEAITPGAPVRITGSTFTNGNGTTATEAGIYGIATGDQAVPAGMPITALKRGVLDGFVLTEATQESVFVSDTDGRLADAAGTVSKTVGRIIPGTAAVLGSSDKLLLVEL